MAYMQEAYVQEDMSSGVTVIAESSQAVLCQEMMRKMNQLRVDGCLCDMNLSADGVMMTAHRIVIATASDFFRELFTTLYPTNAGHIYQIPGVSAPELADLVNFMYTGEIELSAENVHNFRGIAEKLQISSLVRVCDEIIMPQKFSIDQGILSQLTGTRPDAESGENGMQTEDMTNISDLTPLCDQPNLTNSSDLAPLCDQPNLHDLIPPSTDMDVSQSEVSETGLSFIDNQETINNVAEVPGKLDPQGIENSSGCVMQSAAYTEKHDSVTESDWVVQSSSEQNDQESVNSNVKTDPKAINPVLDNEPGLTSHGAHLSSEAISLGGVDDNTHTTVHTTADHSGQVGQSVEKHDGLMVQSAESELATISKAAAAAAADDDDNDGGVDYDDDIRNECSVSGSMDSVQHLTDSVLSSTDSLQNPADSEQNRMDSVQHIVKSQQLITDSVKHLEDSEQHRIDSEQCATNSVEHETDSVQKSTDSMQSEMDSTKHQTDSLQQSDSVQDLADSEKYTTDAQLHPVDSEQDLANSEKHTTDSMHHSADSVHRNHITDSVKHVTDSVQLKVDPAPEVGDTSDISKSAIIKGVDSNHLNRTRRRKGRPKKINKPTEDVSQICEGDEKCSPVSSEPVSSSPRIYGTRSRSGKRTPARPRTELVSMAAKLAKSSAQASPISEMENNKDTRNKKKRKIKDASAGEDTNTKNESTKSKKLKSESGQSEESDKKDELISTRLHAQSNKHKYSLQQAQSSSQVSVRQSARVKLKNVSKRVKYVKKVKEKASQKITKSDQLLKTCQWCGCKRSDLRNHILIKHPDKVLKCDQCSLSFISEESHQQHMERVHRFKFVNGEYHCPLCSYKGKKRIYANKHFSFVHKEKVQGICDQCNRVFSDVKKLAEHQFVVHDIIPLGSKLYTCSVCSFKTITNAKYRDHKRKHQVSGVTHICEECGKIFNLKGSLVAHKKRHHNDNPKWFECEFCDYKNMKISNTYSHRYHVHQKLRPDDDSVHYCRFCSFSDVYKFLVTKHENRNHIQKREKIFLCMFCPKAFAKKDTLKYHESTHTDFGPFPHNCDLCSFSCRTKGQLKKHVFYVHNNIRPFLCDNCGFATKAKGNLVKHKRFCENVLAKKAKMKQMKNRKVAGDLDSDVKMDDMSDHGNETNADTDIMEESTENSIVTLVNTVVCDDNVVLPEGEMRAVTDFTEGGVVLTADGSTVILEDGSKEALVITQEHIYPATESELNEAVGYIVVNESNMTESQ